MRIYDPRLGRFLSVDPITDQYPELTPYQFASNRPIDGIDLDGLEWNAACVMASYAGYDLNGSNQEQQGKTFTDNFIKGLKDPNTYKSAILSLGQIVVIGAVTAFYGEILFGPMATSEAKAVPKIQPEPVPVEVPLTPQKVSPKFEQAGYKYSPEAEVAGGGIVDVTHYVTKDGIKVDCGSSTYIPKERILENNFFIPENLQRQGVSKAAYQYLNNTFDVKKITARYYGYSDNFQTFMRVYDPVKNNAIEALQATQAYKAMPEGYEVTPGSIKIESDKISVEFQKKYKTP